MGCIPILPIPQLACKLPYILFHVESIISSSLSFLFPSIVHGWANGVELGGNEGRLLGGKGEKMVFAVGAFIHVGMRRIDSAGMVGRR